MRSLSRFCFLVIYIIHFWLLGCSEKTETTSVNSDSTQVLGHQQVYPISSCSPCHAEICESYAQTGKGRALQKPDAGNLPERLPSEVVHDRIRNLSYVARWKNNTINILEFRLQGKDTLHRLDYDVAYVIGSGNQTRSYLRETNGYLYEMPLTWYSARQHWDLSPGYEKGANSRFSRPIGNECLACHNSFEKYVPHSVNRFEGLGQGIGCEKCHGDPTNHLEWMRNGDKSHGTGLVNLKTIPLQAQLDVCRNCHLEGVKVPVKGQNGQYEPGKLLSDYWHIFIPTSGTIGQFGFASHAERLQQSACFIGSKGALNCITCHDPHASSPGLEAYVATCEGCHDGGHKQVCALPASTRNTSKQNCVSCHMTQSGTTDIPHVSSHDHFIRKKPGQATNPTSQTAELKSFTENQTTPRDIGLANLIYFETQSLDSAYLRKVARFVQDLEPEYQLKYHYLSGTKPPEHLLSQPSTDPYTLFYQANFTVEDRRWQWYEQVHSLAKHNLDLRYHVAQRQLLGGLENQAREHFQQLYELDPDLPKVLVNLGFYWLNHDLNKAMQLLKRAVELDPDYTLARENLVKAYLLGGNNLEALRQLDVLVLQNPGEMKYKALKSELQAGVKN